MNSKMITNSQLLTTEPKKKEKKTKQTIEQEQNHGNEDHMEGYQQGVGVGRMGEKGIGNKKHKWQRRNRQGEVKNSIRNGEAKELICMTHGHELREGGILVGGRCRAEGNKGEEKNGTTVIA